MSKRWMIALGALCAAVGTLNGTTLQGTQVTGNHQDVPAPTIRVLIVDNTPNALLEIQGKYKIVDSSGERPRIHGKRRLIEPNKTGLKWGEEFPWDNKIALVPTTKETVIEVNGTPYAGSLIVYGWGDAISIVNELPVEEYIAAILGAKLEEAQPEEALNAIAIAERTNVYYQTQHSKNQHWDVEAGSVGYMGSGPYPLEDEIQNSLRATRLMVIGKQGEGLADVVLVPLKWSMDEEQRSGQVSLSLKEAAEEAKNGQHAAQILGKKAPHTAIMRAIP